MSAEKRQHTPGPYVRDGLFVLTKRIENTTGIGELVAKLPEFESRKFVWESEADYQARFRRFCATGDLLAAAPELLAALADCLAFWDAPPTGFDCPTSRRKKLEAIQRNARAAIAKATGGAA